MQYKSLKAEISKYLFMYCLSTFGLSTIWWVMVSSVTSYVLPMQTDLSQDTWPPKHLESDGDAQSTRQFKTEVVTFWFPRRVKTIGTVSSPDDKSQRLPGCLSVQEELEPLKNLLLSLLHFLFLFSGLHVLHVLLREKKLRNVSNSFP